MEIITSSSFEMGRLLHKSAVDNNKGINEHGSTSP